MRADFSKPMHCALAALAVLALSGCSDSLARRDFLSETSGDAVAANKAIHIVDPWKREAFDVRLPVSGARLGAAMQKYQAGDAGASGAGAASFTPGISAASAAQTR